MRVSLIGYGTVGQGVVDVIRRCGADLTTRTGGEALDIGAILVRDPTRERDTTPPPGATITDDADAFFDAPADVIVEVAGGVEAADGFVRRALESGRHVVTANKALLADRGSALAKRARQHDRLLRFEAAVAAGVPCITGLTDGLAANRIERVVGILNGTCNFILTHMEDGLASGGDPAGLYDEALSDAQRRGFAEADPTLDVSGRDAAEKLAILMTLAFGVDITADAIPMRGVDALEPRELSEAAAEGKVVRLIAEAERIDDDRIRAFVRPVALSPGDADRGLLAHARGATNGVIYWADAAGVTSLLGSGAGRLPTASAVVSDLIRIARDGNSESPGRFNVWPERVRAIEIVP